MKITRTGSVANHGPKHVSLTSPTFTWSQPKASLIVQEWRAKDFTGSAHHSYNIEISTSEIIAVLEVLAGAAIADPESIETLFGGALKPLLQFQMTIAGFRVKP